jgi:hypothetical protein
MNAITPWIPTELPSSAKKTSLVDDVAHIVSTQWEADDDFRLLASSTDSDDSVEGSVTIDKILLARLIKQAAGENTRVGNAKVSEIARVMHYAFKRYGIDRKSIAARKAEYLALNAAPVAEPSTPVAV